MQTASAESAIHSEPLWVILPTGVLKRAFSAFFTIRSGSWGDAPGLDESAPLTRSSEESRRTNSGDVHFSAVSSP